MKDEQEQMPSLNGICVMDIGGCEEICQVANTIPISVDSGAAVHVLPISCCPKMPMAPSSNKIQYLAASGHKNDDVGVRRVEFHDSLGAYQKLNFRIADVAKPLASVSKIVNSGCNVVFEENASYIQNATSGQWVPLVERNGAFVMEATVVDKSAKPDFSRQVQ